MKSFSDAANRLLSPLYDAREINRICRLLLEKWSGISAASFYADKDRKIPVSDRLTLNQALERLARHEPLEYVLGEAAFDGMTLQVDKRVLIPRPETEELVDWIGQTRDAGMKIPAQVLDVCTGSGCIALALARRWPSAKVEAWDVSTEALALAAQNAQKQGVAVDFRQVDVLDTGSYPAQTQLFNIVVSNPPYVCAAEAVDMNRNVLDYEPHIALFVSDEDPLVFYRALAKLGLSMLTPGGTLFVEINGLFGAETARLFETTGYIDVTLKKDIAGKDRFVRAIKPSHS